MEKEERVEVVKFGTLPLTDDLRKRAKDWVMERYRAVYSDWQKRIQNYNRWEKQYRSEGGVSRNYQSEITDLFSPETYKHVEGWVTLIMDALFSVLPPAKAVGRKQNISSETLQKIEDVVWYVCREQNFEGKIERIVRQGVKFGTFVAKYFWDMTEVENYEKRYENGAWIDDYYSTPRDLPVISFVDLRNFIMRSDTENPQWAIERIVVPFWRLEAQAKQYHAYENLEAVKKTTFPSSLDPLREEKRAHIKKSETPLIEKLDQDVEILEFHGLFDLEGDGRLVPCQISIANREEVIAVKKEVKDKFPYKVFPFIPVEGSLFGVGIPELISVLQGELNDVINQGMDNKSFMLYCMIAYNEMFIKNKEDLNIRPKGLIRVKGNKNINEVLQFYTPPNFTATVDAHIMRIKSDIADLTHIRPSMLGIQTIPRASATEVSTIVAQTSKEISLTLKRIETNLIEESFNRFFKMIQQNMDRSWWIRTLMDEKEIWKEISPEEIYANAVFEAQGVFHMQNTAVAIKSAQNTLALLQRYEGRPIEKEPGVLVKVNEYAAIEDVLRAEGKKNIDKYFVEVPPPSAPTNPAGLAELLSGAGIPAEGLPSQLPPLPKMAKEATPTEGSLLAEAMGAPVPSSEVIGL